MSNPAHIGFNKLIEGLLVFLARAEMFDRPRVTTFRHSSLSTTACGRTLGDLALGEKAAIQSRHSAGYGEGRLAPDFCCPSSRRLPGWAVWPAPIHGRGSRAASYGAGTSPAMKAWVMTIGPRVPASGFSPVSMTRVQAPRGGTSYC